VIAAQNERDCTAAGDALNNSFEIGAGSGSIAAEHLDIARIDDSDIPQTIDAHRERWPGPVMRQVARRPHCARAQSCPAAIGRAPVERRTNDDDIGTRKARRVVEIATIDAEEGEIWTELGAVTSHTRP
jgi:hypothetical protein